MQAGRLHYKDSASVLWCSRLGCISKWTALGLEFKRPSDLDEETLRELIREKAAAGWGM